MAVLQTHSSLTPAWVLYAALSALNLCMLPGVLEMVKRRPVDVLQTFLEERASTKIDQFFGSYGAAEAAATCLLLCTAPPSPCSQVHLPVPYTALHNFLFTTSPKDPVSAPHVACSGSPTCRQAHAVAGTSSGPLPLLSGMGSHLATPAACIGSSLDFDIAEASALCMVAWARS